jgi:hypothetical protein
MVRRFREWEESRPAIAAPHRAVADRGVPAAVPAAAARRDVHRHGGVEAGQQALHQQGLGAGEVELIREAIAIAQPLTAEGLDGRGQVPAVPAEPASPARRTPRSTWHQAPAWPGVGRVRSLPRRRSGSRFGRDEGAAPWRGPASVAPAGPCSQSGCRVGITGLSVAGRWPGRKSTRVESPGFRLGWSTGKAWANGIEPMLTREGCRPLDPAKHLRGQAGAQDRTSDSGHELTNSARVSSVSTPARGLAQLGGDGWVAGAERVGPWRCTWMGLPLDSQRSCGPPCCS